MADRKPFDPKTTTFTNLALDEIMPALSGNAWKVLCFAIRKTAGWADPTSPTGRKESDIIALSQFETGTGVAHHTAIDAVQECLNSGYLTRCAAGQSFRYRLNLDYTLPTSAETAPVQEAHQCRNCTSTSAETAPVGGVASAETAPELVQKLHTQTLSNPKEEINPNGNSKGEPPPQRPLAAYLTASLQEYESTIGLISGAQQAEEIDVTLADLVTRNLMPWWSMAIKVACDQNKRSWAYVRGTLRNCLAAGTPPGTGKGNTNGRSANNGIIRTTSTYSADA